jgi:uncharacterized protein YxeA
MFSMITILILMVIIGFMGNMNAKLSRTNNELKTQVSLLQNYARVPKKETDEVFK